MGWLIALAVLAALAMLPLGISAVYSDRGADVKALLGPVRIRVYPRKKKPKAPEEPEKKPKTEQSAGKSGQTQPRQGGSLRDFEPLVRLGLEFLSDLRRKLRVKLLELELTLAGEDPCDLGIACGAANAAMADLLARLSRCFVIRKRQVSIDCDFLAEETKIYARVDLTLTLGRLLSLAVRYGVRAFREYLNFSKIRKGGGR